MTKRQTAKFESDNSPQESVENKHRAKTKVNIGLQMNPNVVTCALH